MKAKLIWKEQLKKVIAENDNQPFGHNTEVDIEWYIKKLYKICFDNIEVDIKDYYTIVISMPIDGLPIYSRDILMFILTNPPMPTECRFNKKNNKLTIEWHY